MSEFISFTPTIEVTASLERRVASEPIKFIADGMEFLKKRPDIGKMIDGLVKKTDFDEDLYRAGVLLASSLVTTHGFEIPIITDSLYTGLEDGWRDNQIVDTSLSDVLSSLAEHIDPTPPTSTFSEERTADIALTTIVEGAIDMLFMCKKATES